MPFSKLFPKNEFKSTSHKTEITRGSKNRLKLTVPFIKLIETNNNNWSFICIWLSKIYNKIFYVTLKSRNVTN